MQVFGLQKENILWAESRFSSIFLFALLIFFACLFACLFYPFLATQPKPSFYAPYAESEHLFASAILVFVILVFAFLAILTLLQKPIKISEAGIILGNKYLVSGKAPSIWSSLANFLAVPFRKSRLVAWPDIKKAGVSKLVQDSFWYGQNVGVVPTKTEQDCLVIETKAGEKIWVAVALTNSEKAKLKEILQQKTPA